MKKFSRLLVEQLRSCTDCLESLSGFFEVSSPGREQELGKLCERARSSGVRVQRKLQKGLPWPGREDALQFSRALEDLVERAARAARETLLFDVRPDPRWVRSSQLLEESCGRLASALSGLPIGARSQAKGLVESRRKSDEALAVCREGLEALWDDPGEVRQLKAEAVYGHLTKMAERLGDAAEVAAGMAAVEGV